MQIYVKCEFCQNIFQIDKRKRRKKNYCNRLCTAWATGQKSIEWGFAK